MGTLAWAGGRASRHGRPHGTTLRAKATFLPATALPALPSKPDFNSNISSGVINKPCNPLLQRAGVPAASVSRNPNPLRHQGCEEVFRKQAAAVEALRKPETRSLLPISFRQIFPLSNKNILPGTQAANPAEGSVEKEPVSWLSSSRPHFKPALLPRRGESGVLSVILEPQHPTFTQFKQSYAEPSNASVGTDSLPK